MALEMFPRNTASDLTGVGGVDSESSTQRFVRLSVLSPRSNLAHGILANPTHPVVGALPRFDVTRGLAILGNHIHSVIGGRSIEDVIWITASGIVAGVAGVVRPISMKKKESNSWSLSWFINWFRQVEHSVATMIRVSQPRPTVILAPYRYFRPEPIFNFHRDLLTGTSVLRIAG